ncbi:MAG: type II toxin-antitoxin system RelB/DinJ family antitoxin [Deltaproteobacteria bacterium]|jgi:DNA-damage-inducible protein J|nr:type II toxin-antitoxin system RelB/DinJ family antitoxin [Deltaproteobacteria bacterium]
MANLNIRVDDAVKQQAEAVFAELGMSLSTATMVFLKQAIRCNGIPFDLRLDPFYSASNMAALRAAAKEADEGKLTVHELIED